MHITERKVAIALSGVHSIITEKLAQAGEAGGVHAHPLSIYVSTITYNKL